MQSFSDHRAGQSICMVLFLDRRWHTCWRAGLTYCETVHWLCHNLSDYCRLANGCMKAKLRSISVVGL